MNGHFFFMPDKNLAEVCNAPTDKGGIYIIYALKSGEIMPVYIGCSGEVLDNEIKIRNGGIWDRIVNGHHLYSKMPAKKAFPKRMLEESIEALDIYWFVTLDPTNKKLNDDPNSVKRELIKIFGSKPAWHK